MKGLVPTVAALLLCAGAAVAEDEPYIEDGKRLAEGSCSRCHNVEPGGAFKLYPPSFQAISVYMHPDMIRMRIMYPDHAVLMPQFNTYLFADHLNNIVAYIQSLEE